MGVTAQRHNFLYSVVITYAVLLGQHAHLSGQLARVQAGRVPAPYLYTACIRRGLGNGGDERAFTGSVWTGQHQPLPFLQCKGYIPHGCQFAIADGYFFSCQHDRPPFCCDKK